MCPNSPPPPLAPSVERTVHDNAEADTPSDTQGEKVTRLVGVSRPLFGDGQRVYVMSIHHR